MTELEALELLKHHSYNHDDIEHPKTTQGFLGMLRPFTGQLYEANFHELMSIIKLLKEHFRGDRIERQIISSFWGICHFSAAWGLDEDGMLRRNNLLSAEQVQQLSTWIECVSYTISSLLDGVDDDGAFELYRLYLEDNP
ncbi:hypothetical protein [Hymenobacter arcticus]